MIVKAPSSVRGHWVAEFFVDGEFVKRTASAAAGSHSLDIALGHCCRYTRAGQEWVWDGENWLQGDEAREALKPKKKVKPRGPKKRIADLNDAPGPTDPTIDPKLYAAAEVYAEEWLKRREKQVEASFRKVTKKL